MYAAAPFYLCNAHIVFFCGLATIRLNMLCLSAILVVACNAMLCYVLLIPNRHDDSIGNGRKKLTKIEFGCNRSMHV